MKDKKILYVEDDLSLIEGLKYALEKNGFLVDNARTVKDAHQLFKAGQYDLLLLDVTLPDGTGFDICKEVREISAVPIIFLTASDEETNIVRGLDMGGDDYITKPFKLGEVLSRIHALLRRFGEFHKNDTILESNGIKIDQMERTCWKGETELPLTLVEYKLLCLFLKNPNRILTRELILDRLWDGNGSYVDDNTLSVYIRRLRRKIEDDPNSPTKLLTEIGFGYRWVGRPSAVSMPEKRLTVFCRRNIGFIFQSFNLIPELNVEQNITFPLLLDYQRPDQEHVEELLEILGLKERRKHLPGELSGGQQQRVAIGRALAARPAIIMADEPTGNLDSRNSQEVITLLKSMSAKYRQTILMITHNENHADATDRVLRMTDGRLKDLGVAAR